MRKLTLAALLAVAFLAPLSAVMQPWTVDFHASSTGYAEGETVEFALAIVRTYQISLNPGNATVVDEQRVTTKVGAGGALDFSVTFHFPEDFDPGNLGLQRYMRFYIHQTGTDQHYWYSQGEGEWSPEALDRLLSGDREHLWQEQGNFAVDGLTFSGTTVRSTPEPATLALLVLGAAGLALRRRAA